MSSLAQRSMGPTTSTLPQPQLSPEKLLLHIGITLPYMELLSAFTTSSRSGVSLTVQTLSPGLIRQFPVSPQLPAKSLTLPIYLSCVKEEIFTVLSRQSVPLQLMLLTKIHQRFAGGALCGAVEVLFFFCKIVFVSVIIQKYTFALVR